MRSGDAIIAASLLSLMLVATSHRPRAGDQFEGTRPPEVTLGQIRAGNERFWAAFAARDLWSIGRLWAKTDAVSAIFPAGSIPSVGWENIRESFRRSFAHNRDVKVDAEVVSVRAEGSAAWLVDAVRFEAVQTQTGQSVVMDRILGTKLFERSGDGQWRADLFSCSFPWLFHPEFPLSTSRWSWSRACSRLRTPMWRGRARPFMTPSRPAILKRWREYGRRMTMCRPFIHRLPLLSSVRARL